MELAIDKIRTDGGTQPREKIDYLLVQEYQESYKAGAIFPSVVVFYDGKDYWLADGFHRLSAAPITGAATIDADVKQGTREDAVWYSCGANKGHGLRRTNADKRRAVVTALQHQKSKKMSDRAIAEYCGVGHPLVSEIRGQLEESSNSLPPRIGRDGKKYDPRTNKDAAKKRSKKQEATPPNESPAGQSEREKPADHCANGGAEENPSYDLIANQFLALVPDALLLTVDQQDSLLRLMASRIGSKRAA